MLSTDKQTNKQTDKLTNQRYQKHNLLCQGGNKDKDLLDIYQYDYDPFCMSLLTDEHLKVRCHTDFV